MEKSSKRIYLAPEFYFLILAFFIVIELLKSYLRSGPFYLFDLSAAASWATIAQALFACGILVQISHSRIELQADHERSRREKSVEILTNWTQNLKEEGPIARKILEKLSEEQCREVFNGLPLKVDKKHETLVAQFFGEGRIDTSDEADFILLKEELARSLRWHAVTYLNSLELVFVSWQYSIVDREIIESQFTYLFDPSNGHEMLKHFRKAAGGGVAYPAIEIFAAHVQKKRSERLIQKTIVA